jgi:hypothetical protein
MRTWWEWEGRRTTFMLRSLDVLITLPALTNATRFTARSWPLRRFGVTSSPHLICATLEHATVLSSLQESSRSPGM